MSLTNPKNVVTEERLSEFYQGIFPYLGGMPEMVANKFSKGDLYSTDEKMIGQWIDGKPLYQKVLTGTVSDATHFNIPSGILVHNVFGSFYTVGNNTVNAVYLFGGGSSWISWWVDYAHNYIEFNMSSQHSNMSGEIVIQYTKTADSAIAIGDENDYSTTEKIVGTWIDGKPLYQKVVTGTMPNASDSISTGLTNLSMCLIKCGFIKLANNIISLGYYGGTSDYCFVDLEGIGNSFWFSHSGGRFSNSPFSIVLNYTKTTD